MLYFQLKDNASSIKYCMCCSTMPHVLQEDRPSIDGQATYLLLKHILWISVICLEREFRYIGSVCLYFTHILCDFEQIHSFSVQFKNKLRKETVS